MLEFKNVSYKYVGYDKKIVDNLSFKVEEGEFVSLIGVSGCGKSTIFKLVNGVLPINEGDICIKGKALPKTGRQSGCNCGYMPQRDLLFPWRTLEENLKLPLETANKTEKTAAKALIGGMLKQIGLENCGSKYPFELSGGMRQRAAFGRTLLTGAQLLLLDEPFSALDFLTKISMQQWLLEQWQEAQKTVLFITHDVEEAIFLSNRILVVTQTPITQLLEVKINLPYPRNREMLCNPEVLEIKNSLIETLKRQVVL